MIGFMSISGQTCRFDFAHEKAGYTKADIAACINNVTEDRLPSKQICRTQGQWLEYRLSPSSR
jgi:hypothetical protein